MKALGLVVSDKKIFENCILKTYLLTPWPTYATNLNGLNNFTRGPPRDHSNKFGQIPISGSGEDVVLSFPYINQCRIVTPGAGSILTPGHNLNNFGRGPLDDAIYQIWKLWAL